VTPRGGAPRDALVGIERRLRDCPLFLDATVSESGGRVQIVVRPDLTAIWRTGTANVAAVVRVTLWDIVRDATQDLELGEIIIARGGWGEPACARTIQQAAESHTPNDELGRCLWLGLQRRFPKVDLHADLCPRVDLGIDSLDWLELLLALEQDSGLGLSEAAAAEIITLGDLLDAFRESASRNGHVTPSLGERRTTLLEAPQRSQWLAPRSLPLRLFGWSIHALDRGLMRHWFQLRVSGLENLPERAPFILAANHLSDLDIPALLAAIPRPRLTGFCWGGNRERLFHNHLARLFCRAGHVFPLDDRLPLDAVASGIACLRAGRPLVWFPESWRSPDGRIQPLQRGIGVLAYETLVPIVPAIIQGTFEAWPRYRRWPQRHPVSITIGEPLLAQDLDCTGEGKDGATRITNALRRALQDLQAAIEAEVA
jgi:long-chain acyl-CoA synthetase